MAQTCPNCGTPISKRWLLLGAPSDVYTCPTCKTQYEWTRKRYLINFLVGLIGALPIIIVFKFSVKGLSYFTVGLFYLGILILDAFLILNIPGQFKRTITLEKKEHA